MGGKFVASCTSCQMTVKTNNNLERRKSSNVIGILKGQIEPDRYPPINLTRNNG